VTERVLTFEEARSVVLWYAERVSAPSAETIAIEDALGRVLASDVAADRDYPPFPRATRDGYAVRAVDLANLPATLKVVGQIKAGDDFRGEIASGSCAEIMTGAAVPHGADAVVMVEFTARRGDSVHINRGVAAGENVVPRGAESKQSEIVLRRGTRIGPQEVSVLTTIGCTRVQVFPKPAVAVLSTGDEVVEIDKRPGPVQIRNSNAYSLSAQIASAGGVPTRLLIAPDKKVRLRELIERGLEADLLLLSGGVSMGKYDLVEQVLHELGARFYFTGVKIQPGKPLVFGHVRGKYFFGLPGNPVSTMVTFRLFASAMLDALGGAKPGDLRFTLAELSADVSAKTGLTRFLPAKLTPDIRRPTVSLVPWNGSGDVFAQAKADCLLVIPPDRERIPKGEMVTILPIQ
jgi:molybdopterin molybdotransferase